LALGVNGCRVMVPPQAGWKVSCYGQRKHEGHAAQEGKTMCGWIAMLAQVKGARTEIRQRRPARQPEAGTTPGGQGGGLWRRLFSKPAATGWGDCFSCRFRI